MIRRFVSDYRSGRTPNPCVSCNTFVKLGTLRTFALRLGARYVATGHYARIEHRDDGPHLFTGLDTRKDQSYALSALSPEQLSTLLLPLGTLEKAATREHALRLGLNVHDKPESQENLLRGGRRLPYPPRRARPSARGCWLRRHDRGPVASHKHTRTLALHNRAASQPPRYTLQRRPPIRNPHRSPTNAIVIGREEELSSFGLIADEVNLIRPERFQAGALRVRAMTRYRSPFNAAMASFDEIKGELHLRFSTRRTRRGAGPNVRALRHRERRGTSGGDDLREALVRRSLAERGEI